MKIAIVNPIAPVTPTISIPLQVTPCGSTHSLSRTATQPNTSTPTGLPTSRPSATPLATAKAPGSEKSTPPMATPALARAKSGMIP